MYACLDQHHPKKSVILKGETRISPARSRFPKNTSKSFYPTYKLHESLPPSFLAQWKRAGLIPFQNGLDTPRSSDRDREKLLLFGSLVSSFVNPHNLHDARARGASPDSFRTRFRLVRNPHIDFEHPKYDQYAYQYILYSLFRTQPWVKKAKSTKSPLKLQ